MARNLQIGNVIKNDWDRLKTTINKLKLKLGPDSIPEFQSITLNGLNVSEFVMTDANKKLVSEAVPLVVAKGGTGLTTITDHSIMLGSGTDAVTPLGVATNGQIPIGSTGADPALATITGTAKRVIVTNGAGSITLSGPQDLDTVDSPVFAGLTIVNAITEFSTDGTLADNSDSALPTEKAVKTYVDDYGGGLIGNIFDCGTSDITLDEDISFGGGYSL